MDDRSVCTPHFAESDAQNNTTSTPIAASATDADKVINTKIDSTQVEGDQSEEELLKGLLTDDYCHVCEAVLLFESQRLSHYEGKKHAQKLKVYLQAKRAEKMNKEATGPQLTMMADKDRFCELCNMVFSSPVVAKSHYEGKVHIKNLRKQGLQPSDRYKEVCTSPSLTQDPGNADQQSASEGDMEHLLDPTPTTASAEVDLKDSNKYCALCAASFNNPQMALQHYNGRKHQRNAARQELLRELGDDVQEGSCHTLRQEALKVVYPKIHSAENIECNCAGISCDSVYWFRSISNHNKVEFLGRYNNADRAHYADKDKEAQFKFTRGSSASFMLRINNVTGEDTGIYSCVLRNRTHHDMWKPGVLLLPGVTPPTKPPEIKKPQKPINTRCSCNKKKPSQTPDGCGSVVLWSLVGLIVVLALAIICTLYYFSRLPKKCRHHVVRKR
ncbi:zinc finger matrin-type protein 1-like isoform X2 [Thunnus maccoyii]|uniref:zinc finger matrin-type protein 1-like isoform X2 n=1 Tax=Thunnus maccoyii TaxID=8240 RepID=UPI001C4C1C44|nr:zinc finger matrin-type protein 1-like isoform X2 [Thunnus maccoyii]